jgi:hypothetical protein
MVQIQDHAGEFPLGASATIDRQPASAGNSGPIPQYISPAPPYGVPRGCSKPITAISFLFLSGPGMVAMKREGAAAAEHEGGLGA